MFQYILYIIDKQNIIPVCVSNNGLYYVNKKDITLKELMRIKDACQNRPSDHYMLTPRTIIQLGINGSIIEAYMQAQPQEIRLFIKCVLPKHHKNIAPQIKNWIIQKRKHNHAIKYQEIFYYLDVMFDITPWYELKFPEIVQQIYNAIFVGACQISLTRTKRPGKTQHGLIISTINIRKNYLG